MSVGKIIREKRENMRMLQKDLAKKMGCGTSLICKWENGQLSPSINQLRKLESILSTNILTKEFMEKAGGNS